jgi:hypothetical protein
MAARHLKRLQEQKLAAASEPEDTDDEEPAEASAPFNPFDLLSDDEVRRACGADRACSCCSLHRQPSLHASLHW